jgi:PAS domain S-box-containing protein
MDQSGQSAGITVEFINWMGVEIGFIPRITHLSYSDAQEAVLRGEYDVLNTLSTSVERKKYFEFSDVMLEASVSVFVPITTDSIHSKFDLKNKTVVIQRGSYVETFFKKQNIPITIRYEDDLALALKQVLNGEATALIANEKAVLFEAHRAGLNLEIQKVCKPLYTELSSMAVKKDQKELIQLLNKGIAEAKRRGVLDQIQRKWLGTPLATQESFLGTSGSTIATLALALVFLLGLIAAWNIQLRRTVNKRTMEVKKRELAYRALTENSMDLIIRHDHSLQIIYVNLAAARFANKKVYDLQKASLWQVGFAPETCREWEIAIREVFVTGRSTRIVLQSSLDEKTLWLDCLLVPELSAQNIVESVLSTCRDITETKKAEEDRHSLELQMQQAQKLESLGVMAGGIAHDFNNLLTIIRGNAELAIMEISASASYRGYLHAIEETTQRASSLCSQLLAYTGKSKFVTGKIDLNALLGQTTDLLVVSLAKRAVLKLELSPELPFVEGDQTQLQQIVMNLVLNAAEAVLDKQGQVVIQTGVQECSRSMIQAMPLHLESQGGLYVYIKVSDNGCGMSEETMERIFDPFFTTKFTGRGLGLAAVLGIVKSHGGFLKVSSVPGEGSDFTVWLPAVVEANKVNKTITQNIASAWRGQGVVLLADDEEPVRKVTRKLLEKAGFDVLLAVDGREAVDLFRQNHEKIRVVILDLTMPEMDGIEAMRKMKATDSDLKVILSSGYHELEARALLQSNELPDAFLEKPYSFSTLIKTLRQVLENESASLN